MAVDYQQQDNFAEDVIFDLQQCVKDKIKKCKKNAKSAIRLHDKDEKTGCLDNNLMKINRRLDSLKSARIKLMVLDDNWTLWPGSFHKDINSLLEREKKLEIKFEEIIKGQQEFGNAHKVMEGSDEQDVIGDSTNDDLINVDIFGYQYTPECSERILCSNEEAGQLIHVQKIQIHQLKIDLMSAHEKNKKLKELIERKGIKTNDSSSAASLESQPAASTT